MNLAEIEERLRRREAELAAVHAVTRAGAEGDLPTLLPQLAEIATLGTASDRGTIYLLEGETLVRAALCGDYGPLRPKYDRLPVAASQSGAVAQSFAPRAMTLADWPEVCRADFAAAGFLHHAIVPLRIADKLAGTLNLARVTERPYSTEELASAQALADHLALQIEKARLYAAANRRLSMLGLSFELMQLGAQATTVPDLIAQALAAMERALEVDGVALRVLDEEGALRRLGGRGVLDAGAGLRVAERIPLDGDTISARAVRERRTIVVRSDELTGQTQERAVAVGMHHGLAAALIAHGRVLGCVSFVRASARPFGPEEVATVESCAATLAVAMEHTRLFERERRRASDLRLINELGALISAELQLRTVLDVGVRHVARIADVPQAFLLLREGDGMHMLASNVEEFGVLDIVIPLGEASLVQACVAERQPIFANDPLHDPRVNVERTRRFKQTALLAVPLILRGELLGALLLGETAPDRPFTQESLERATAMANQLATALGNAQLFESLQRRNAELARAQEKLVERERLAALGELAAVVAHEVRNPLAVIFNSLAGLRREGATPEQTARMVDIVAEEAERLNRIVGELLEFARPGEPQLARESLDALIQGASEAASKALGAKVLIEVPASMPPVMLDRQLFHQALVNLISNGAQSRPGGAVRLRATEEIQGGRAYARIDVTDQGPGIPAHHRAQIFQPFFTTRARGTGLGLAIVKRIVEAHGGAIGFESTTDAGTTFTLRVPIDGRPG